jgi:hypothetical protein
MDGMKYDITQHNGRTPEENALITKHQDGEDEEDEFDDLKA